MNSPVPWKYTEHHHPDILEGRTRTSATLGCWCSRPSGWGCSRRCCRCIRPRRRSRNRCQCSLQGKSRTWNTIRLTECIFFYIFIRVPNFSNFIYFLHFCAYIPSNIWCKDSNLQPPRHLFRYTFGRCWFLLTTYFLVKKTFWDTLSLFF